MTNNFKVHFNLGRWLGLRWWGWRCGGQPNNIPPPHTHLPPSSPPLLSHNPPIHVPINAFASCFQVRTERCDWPRRALWAVPPALSSARVTVELELRHSPERSVVHGFKKKEKKERQHTPAWKCWSADLEPPSRLVSRSSLPAALFVFEQRQARGRRTVRTGHSACPSWTRGYPAGAHHARGTALRAGRDIYNRNSIPFAKKNSRGRRSER